MTDRFVVDASALDRLSRRYAGAATIVADELMGAARRSILTVQALAQRNVKVDMGHLRRSITSESRAIAGGVRSVAGTNLPYGEAVEKGRRAGAPMPPAGSLLGWLRRHGIDESAEFVVRRAIARRGIPAAPYLIPAFQAAKPAIIAEFGRVPERVLTRLAARR